MGDDKLAVNNPNDDIFDKLFGDPSKLDDEELGLLYEVVAPGENPSEAVYRAAEAAAVTYRKDGKVPPEHVQAALKATRGEGNFAKATPSLLERIVEGLTAPVRGPIEDPAFAYRNRQELSTKDLRLLEDLSNELRTDWDKDEWK